ncbi:GNAT family N-acetyltransferase [Candidatus Chloroploca sp. M-50]|uniref:GNAT family N-acetyltransferase n=1 Tax=Candidatus Chloroploca mongolica TaxID=2528176 RepID=A0ABS4D9G6_9CHLR|nr:GNAT family N-acetyltransferase [Candidatus Chloroploca mongolica]
MSIAIGHSTIRAWALDDAEALARYANNPNVAANLRDGFPHPYPKSDAEAFLRNAIARSPRTIFAIARDEEAIGSIGLMIGSDVHRFTGECSINSCTPRPMYSNRGSLDHPWHIGRGSALVCCPC